MPGMVVRVTVKPGEQVFPGAGLLVLEAMKMENEIRTGQGGVVKEVFVRAGQAVDKGAALIEIAVVAQGVDRA